MRLVNKTGQLKLAGRVKTREKVSHQVDK